MKRIDIKNIKQGTLFYEKNEEYIALEDAYISSKLDNQYKQYSVNGKHTTHGHVVDFMETETLEHYGPKLTTN